LSAKTVVVLLPGLDGTGTLFAPFVKRVPSRFETQVFSYPEDRVLDYRQLEARIAERLPEGRPFVLVGESFAGPIALRLSLRGIPGLKAVVLAASFITPPRPRWLSVLPIGTLFRLPRPMFLIRRFITGPLGDVQAAGAASAAVHPDVLAHRLRATLRVDVRDAARDCPVPVLCLVASNDWLVRPRCSRELLEARPSARVVTLQGPHMILQNQPDRAWECISRMLGEATDRRSESP
jgi:pimeloyl-ACP methyl ester carboxylesterase